MRKPEFKRILLSLCFLALALTSLAGCVVYDDPYYSGRYGYYRPYGPYAYYYPGYSDYRYNRWRE